ncbi:MAG: hypothetical protein ACE15C_05265 [Phycisphaerae bacterium]
MLNPRRSRVYLSAIFILVFITMQVEAATVPLRGDFPAGAAGEEAIPVNGGVPMPRGQLKSADNVRLLDAAGKEIPSQATATAWWSDKSVKWVMVDAVLSPDQAKALTLEYGQNVKRADVADRLKVDEGKTIYTIAGGGVEATVGHGDGFMDKCVLGGKNVVEAGKPAHLVLNTIRIPEGASGKAFPAGKFLCRDATAVLDTGKPVVESVTVESPGPIRVTLCIRGYVALEHLGAKLPKEVRDREPAGRMPFSLRLSFYRNCPVITGQHQIIFSGEPDCDFISRWGIELPSQAADRGTLVLEPGVELNTMPYGKQTLAKEQTRLCWAPMAGGFAMIRQGWQNRPCAITQEGGSAFIDFWPQAAGAWDLRRYAREWAVGESGDTRKPALMENFAKYAARGIAKSHDFVIYAGKADTAGAAPAVVRSLAGRALLVAKPSWYASTEALGPFVPEQTAGDFAGINATTRRHLDYYLFNQDLYQWYGKLVYGYWQTRFGEIHRTDRWENDYGRWAWSLNDGAGRIGHLLMLQYLRTLDRRYLEAGEAFNRINYDTNMVHTQMHLEDSMKWWTCRGCSHRHNVQPFGCPYIGMRGSYPMGQKIVHLLTGDGISADGLDIVADACFHYATDQRWRLANSGDSDGQGSAACALLWKYETTGDEKYLTACRTVLDNSGLIPPPAGKGLGYGPSFGLFMAAGEYADLTGDKAYQDKVVECGRIGLKDKNVGEYIHPIAMAVRFSKDEQIRTALADVLKKIAAAPQDSLEDLPPALWPGHGGYKVARNDPNLQRDLPYAMAAVGKGVAAEGDWPKLIAPTKAVPAAPPPDWFKPGGAQGADERVPTAAEILALKPGTGGGALKAAVVLVATDTLCDSIEFGGRAPLASGIVPYVELATLKDEKGQLATKFDVHQGKVEKIGPGDGGTLVASGRAGPAAFTARIRAASADGVSSARVEMALTVPAGSGHVASWGLLVPLKPGKDGHAIQVTTPGAFRLERCRLDQNDERIPNWLTSEYHWGEGAPLWPKWRVAGIDMGPGKSYRLWRANREDTVPVYCDQGQGTSNWLDLTDRGANPRWGLTARIIRPAGADGDASRQAVRVNMETGVMEIQFHAASAPPLAEPAATAGLSGAADLIFHDGWRPPLAKPELTAEQYARFMKDLDYGGNYGLMALRFCLSITHQMPADHARKKADEVRDLGIEPREILYGMLWKDSLAAHCKKIGVKWDANDIEGSVRAVIDHYRK